MSFPGVPIIRIGYMAPHLPYPVNVHLPPTKEPDTRVEIRTSGPQLDIAVPQDLTRHEKLGRFMEAWSSLESTLALLLSNIMTVELGDAGLIIPKLGTRNALDLLEALGMRKLDSTSSFRLSGYMDRVHKLNTKRNVLVHGHWVLEANVILKRGEACLVTQFLREVTPDDPEEAKAMGNPRNQKARVRYSFTVKRIEAATRDTDALNRVICESLQLMRPKELSPSELGQLLLRKRPYRVTYS